jgi:CrcB protein
VSALVWVGVALLGGGAAIGRSVLDWWIGSHLESRFPYGIFAVNTSGTLLLGLLYGLAVRGDALVLLGGATLGSYTTFSTWMLQTRRLAVDGEMHLAIANVLLSLGVGIAAAALGRAIGTGL